MGVREFWYKEQFICHYWISAKDLLKDGQRKSDNSHRKTNKTDCNLPAFKKVLLKYMVLYKNKHS